MAKKMPRIPKQEIVDRIRRKVVAGDRGPFSDLLADALAVAPSKTALRSLARSSPGQYVSMVKELAELSGYASRHESVSIRHDARSMALELVNRVGEKRAREILRDFNLPPSLIASETPSASPESAIDSTGIGAHGENAETPRNDRGED